ncbi:MAG: peptidylprolyl isomerase [Hyphomonadaceae bacterium]
MVRSILAAGLLAAFGLAGAAAQTPPAARLQAAPAAPRAAAPPAAARPGAPTPPAAPQQQGEGIAAVVNDQVISTFDVSQRSALILISAGIPPTTEALRQVRPQALRALVDDRLQLQEAKDHDIKVEAREIDAALADIARSNNTSVDQLQRQLGASGIAVTTLRGQLESALAWRRLVNARYASRVRISNRQVQDTLSRIAANASKPQYNISLILLPADTPAEIADATAAAQRLMEEISKGANFQLVARQFSGAPSAAAGGDLGWLAQGELKPDALQAAVDRGRPGQLIGPVAAPGGVYIVALRDKRDGVDAKTATRVTLKQIAAASNQRALVDRVRRKVRGCDGVDAAVSGEAGVTATDLGEVNESQLDDEMRQHVSETGVGQASTVFEADGKARSLVVCARDTAGGAIPSRDEIEQRLFEDELALQSQRYLRNLRRESTILTR